jgi:hypothetical protein
MRVQREGLQTCIAQEEKGGSLPQVQNKEEESVIFMGVFFSHEKS